MSESTPERVLGPRVTELEELFTHLQRTIQELDEVIVNHAKRLDRLEKTVECAADQLAALRGEPDSD